MTWRVVIIGSASKLDLRLNHMVVRGEKATKIHLSEISVVILENTAISMTAALLCELNRRGIKIIFCDEKRNPYGELIPYNGCHDSVRKLRQQIDWNLDVIEAVWAEIIRQKIINQRNVLRKHNRTQAEMLTKYASEVEAADISNREGHSAKVYFNALFGKDFVRGDDCVINTCLNYGYAIIMSAINREISINGYALQLGISHCNVFNPYNLGCDLMEPFRPIVDDFVFESGFTIFDVETKRKLAGLLNIEIRFDGKTQTLINAMRLYCKGILDALSSGNLDTIKECVYEE